MFLKLFIGQEKAITGGIVAALLALLTQINISGQMTVKEALTALVAWIVAHCIIWLTTNTTKA